jgi:hypothetical protein
VQVASHHLGHGLTGEHRPAGQQEIPDAAEGVQVAPGVHSVGAGDRLRSEVERRAREGIVVAGLSLLLQIPHQPEVHHLRDVPRAAPLGHQNYVAGLDVPVDQPHAVRLGERAGDLAEDVTHPAGLLCALAADQVLEVDAVEVLHRVVEDAVHGAPVVEDRDGVGMAEPAGELDLALEAPQVLRRGPAGTEQLDGGRPPQHHVARPIDLAHSASADLLQQCVLAELRGFAYLPPEAEDHVRGHGGDHHGAQAPEAGPYGLEESRDRRRGVGRIPDVRGPDREAGREEAQDQRPEGGAGDDDGPDRERHGEDQDGAGVGKAHQLARQAPEDHAGVHGRHSQRGAGIDEAERAVAPGSAPADQPLEQIDPDPRQHQAAVQVHEQAGPPHQRHCDHPAHDQEAQVDEDVGPAQEREAFLEEGAGLPFAQWDGRRSHATEFRRRAAVTHSSKRCSRSHPRKSEAPRMQG